MMEEIKIPRYIDDPMQILFWSMDEFIPIGVGLIGGIITSHAFIGIGIGMFLAKIYRRVSEGKQDGMLFHMLYNTGIWPAKSKTFINPYSRKFIS